MSSLRGEDILRNKDGIWNFQEKKLNIFAVFELR